MIFDTDNKAMIVRVIRAAMNSRSWRLEHLSVHSGIPKSTLDAILFGRRKLSEQQRLRLNAAFGWDNDWYDEQQLRLNELLAKADGWHDVKNTTMQELTNDKEMTDEVDPSQASD